MDSSPASTLQEPVGAGSGVQKAHAKAGGPEPALSRSRGDGLRLTLLVSDPCPPGVLSSLCPLKIFPSPAVGFLTLHG